MAQQRKWDYQNAKVCGFMTCVMNLVKTLSCTNTVNAPDRTPDGLVQRRSVSSELHGGCMFILHPYATALGLASSALLITQKGLC